MMLTIDQANRIRELWYIMDGPSDRPRQVSEWAEIVEGLLGVVSEITGIDSAAAITPMEPAAPAAADTMTEYAALTSEQQDRVLAGGKITGIPMHCEYCAEMPSGPARTARAVRPWPATTCGTSAPRCR
jgi:hypothetical protein